jgi:hypothetical protein
METPAEPSPEGAEESSLEDYQLARALDLLHGIALYEDQQPN